jgi:hypothetical protein
MQVRTEQDIVQSRKVEVRRSEDPILNNINRLADLRGLSFGFGRWAL